MSFSRTLLTSAVLACGAAGTASAQYLCSASDASIELSSDCAYTSWDAILIVRFGGQSFTEYVGSFGGGAVCDTGGLNCDGSNRPFTLYKSTKYMQSWNQWDPQQSFVGVWWVTMDQQLHYESCQTPNGDSANSVTNFAFPRSTPELFFQCN